MTARTVLNTDTLETFRTTFNSLSTTDIGDPAALTTTATNLVGAINEVSSGIYSGFTIVDSSSSTTQTILGGDTITFDGDSNITAAVTAKDTVTFSLNSTISGISSITSGAVQILNNRVLTTDSSNLILQDIIGITNTGSITGITNLSATTLTDGTMSINSGSLTGVVNITGSGTANFTTDVQVNGISVSTQAFAIAQAVALG